MNTDGCESAWKEKWDTLIPMMSTLFIGLGAISQVWPVAAFCAAALLVTLYRGGFNARQIRYALSGLVVVGLVLLVLYLTSADPVVYYEFTTPV